MNKKLFKIFFLTIIFFFCILSYNFLLENIFQKIVLAQDGEDPIDPSIFIEPLVEEQENAKIGNVWTDTQGNLNKFTIYLEFFGIVDFKSSKVSIFDSNSEVYSKSISDIGYAIKEDTIDYKKIVLNEIKLPITNSEAVYIKVSTSFKESNYGDNKKTLEIKSLPKPDLFLKSADFLPISQEISATICSKNLIPDQNFIVRFSLNGKEKNKELKLNSECEKIYFKISDFEIFDSGSFNLQVVLDPQNKISEETKSNNKFSKIFSITIPKPVINSASGDKEDDFEEIKKIFDETIFQSCKIEFKENGKFELDCGNLEILKKKLDEIFIKMKSQNASLDKEVLENKLQNFVKEISVLGKKYSNDLAGKNEINFMINYILFLLRVEIFEIQKS